MDWYIFTNDAISYESQSSREPRSSVDGTLDYRSPILAESHLSKTLDLGHLFSIIDEILSKESCSCVALR